MESYHLLFLACIVLLMAAPALLLLARIEAQPRIVPEAPHKQSTTTSIDTRETRKKNRRSFQLEPWRQLRSRYESIDEVARLFRQSGVSSAADQMRYLIYGVAAAAIFSLLLGVVLGAGKYSAIEAFAYAVIAFVVTLLVMKRGLKGKADKRQKALEDEALMLIQTTRMLWRVGLSLPKTLGILCDELRHLTPNTATELKIAVKRIDAGQAQDEALQELCNNTHAEGFREYLIILRQESSTGGGVDKSLQELYEVLQSRRKTNLQEKVSKTSANMSVVMMLMMFPALIIVIGGPGFIAISRALSTLNGG
ncbi:tight adherence protein C [Litorivivens lipolytica]|uniref:Tight adherence protein C n=1 Tax=Litorivivens lipolytica TaxID=1524264 RepID=A0A7W4W3E9_9GAMM|nr:type II secretion system F family protein [Litorivivens lipolytica]MBB3046732.1 tight adherence protein C [Litorivivens lipolytica]